MIKSVGILVAILVLVPILGIHTHNTAYSSTSSSKSHNIQNPFDNLLQLPLPLPFEVPRLGEDGKTESESDQVAALASCGPSVRDLFVGQYRLLDGQTSPNGEWKNLYSGHGSTGVKEFYDGRTVFWLLPKASTSPSETHAGLVRTHESFCNFTMKVDMNTEKQLRKNSPPNTWETGWLLWRYSDTFHYYWLLVKPNGIELGKKDCNACTNPVDGQKFLVTKTTPKLAMKTWNNVQVDMVGNNIKVYWNGVLVINYTDKTMSPKLASGGVAMYSEDAYVLFDNMRVYPK